MDQTFKVKLKLGALFLALIIVSGCSSSPVDEDPSAAPADPSAQTGDATASTDAVPPPESAPPADSAAPPADGSAPPAVAAEATPAPDGFAQQPPPDAMAANLDSNQQGSLDAPIPPPAQTAPPATVVGSTDPVTDPAPVTENTSAMASNTPPAPVPVASNPPMDNKSMSAPSGDASDYTVKQGDTLMKIAFEQYGDLYRWKEIYDANRSAIRDPNAVPPGTKLTLNGAGQVTIDRNGEQYLIKHGDTLGTISNDVYGTKSKWKKLWENNRQLIKDPNRIYAGFYLYYQSEGRLSHGNSSGETDSAMNTPEQAPAPAPAAVTPAAPAPAAVATAPAMPAGSTAVAPAAAANDATRTPASAPTSKQ